MAWFHVASHLKVPVEELQGRITTTEFLEWIHFLRLEDDRNSKSDLYLAQIAAEIRRGWVEDAREVKVSDFLLGAKPVLTPEQRMKKSKAAWGAMLTVASKRKANARKKK